MGSTFAEKFEEALDAKRLAEPGYGLRTLARKLADNDPDKTKTILRRLQKYRPRNGGGAAEVAPTKPTRNEIEKALGLEVDALAPDEQDIAAALRQQARTAAALRLVDALEELEDLKALAAVS